MRNASVKTAPWIVQIAVLFVAISIGCLGSFGADAAATGFSAEQILPPQHGVSIDGIQVAPSADLGGEQASLMVGVLFAGARNVQVREQVWRDQPGPRDVRWRKIFLLSRFNTKYKQSPFHPTL